MIMIILTLAAIAAAAGFALGWYQRSTSQKKAIEAMAHANQTAVAVRADASQAGASLPAILLDSIGVPMGYVPGGPFQMGSLNGEQDELPVRTILLDDYFIDTFEVTNGLYQRCVEAGVCHPPLKSRSQTRKNYYGNPEYEDYPVIFVQYEEAMTFCEWRQARLPTEAEWEKAARGGLEDMDYPWGNQSPACVPGAPNGANFDRCIPQETWPVGSFAPNGYGLYDMAGNVWEWVADWYDNGYNPESPTTNPTGPQVGGKRVLRGGGWTIIDWYLRVSARLENFPVDAKNNTGFRCAKSP